MVTVNSVPYILMTALTLLVATLMDYRTRFVYRFVWWPVVGSYLVYFLSSLFSCPHSLCTVAFSEFILFCFLQECFFCRFYGRADCHGFAVGAATLFLQGGGMWQFLLQMVFAFLILFLAQLCARNINSRGNLKLPVAFLPYITVGWGLVQLTNFQ